MKKKSIKKSIEDFEAACDEIVDFVIEAQDKSMSDQSISWTYDYAIIRLYREFESLILDAIVASINNDTATISSTTGVNFPKHLTDEVCEYLVTGDQYFDFKGRDGLIRTLKRFVPEDHYLCLIVKNAKHKQSLERLSALRNFAAHNSAQAKSRALKVVDQDRLGSAGSWLKIQNRFHLLVRDLKLLTHELQAAAPY
jgi:cupin superfamily acireductone dioxygenase involved in methionine salvage